MQMAAIEPQVKDKRSVFFSRRLRRWANSSVLDLHVESPPLFARHLPSNVSETQDWRPKICYFFQYFGGWGAFQNL
jgi:hypothetical protein